MTLNKQMDQTFGRNVFAPYKDICLGKQNRDMYESVNTTLPKTLAYTRTGYSCVWKVTCVLHLFPKKFSLQCVTIMGAGRGTLVVCSRHCRWCHPIPFLYPALSDYPRSTASFQCTFLSSTVGQQAGRQTTKHMLCLCRSIVTIQKPSERLQGRGRTNRPRDLLVHWQPAHRVLLDQKRRAGVVFVRLVRESFIRRHLKSISAAVRHPN